MYDGAIPCLIVGKYTENILLDCYQISIAFSGDYGSRVETKISLDICYFDKVDLPAPEEFP